MTSWEYQEFVAVCPRKTGSKLVRRLSKITLLPCRRSGSSSANKVDFFPSHHSMLETRFHAIAYVAFVNQI